jgi:hypothetical protein
MPAGQAAAATLRALAARSGALYRAGMDLTALILMASALTYSGFVVLLGWR